MSIFAIGVEVTMVLTLVGISNGLLRENQRQRNGVGADIWVRPPGSSVISMSNAAMPEKMVEFFGAQPHVALATGSVSQGIGGLDSVQGIDVEKFTALSGSFCCIAGDVFKHPDDIIVDRRWAEQKNLQVGSKLEHILNRNWRVSGIVESGKLGRVFLPLGTVQELTGNPGRVSQIYLKLDDKANLKSVLASLKSNPDLENYTIIDTEELLSQFSLDNIPIIKPFIGVVIGVAVIVGFLVVFLSMYTAVLERTREIGILKSMGATPTFILSILLKETFVLAIVGLVLGISLTYLTRYAVTAYGGTWLVQIIAYDWWPTAAAIALGGSLLGTLYPGWKAVRQDALEALSYD